MGVGSGPAPFRDLVSPDGHHLTLITGCVFAAYAYHTISSTPSYIQVSTSPALAAGLPRWVLWTSAVQVAAAALPLAPPLGRRVEARRALSVLAILASFASSMALLALLLVYINYMLDTWSCDALWIANSVAWQSIGLVLQLIALALLW